MEQLTLFDLMEQQSDFPCDNCVFDRCGRCVHVENEECYCVMGSFQIKLKDIICPHCGELMDACGKRVCSSEEHWGCPYGNEGMTDCAVLLEAAYEDTIEKLLALKETLEG